LGGGGGGFRSHLLRERASMLLRRWGKKRREGDFRRGERGEKKNLYYPNFTALFSEFGRNDNRAGKKEGFEKGEGKERGEREGKARSPFLSRLLTSPRRKGEGKGSKGGKGGEKGEGRFSAVSFLFFRRSCYVWRRGKKKRLWNRKEKRKKKRGG